MNRKVSLDCADCQTCTFKMREYYMLKRPVWLEAVGRDSPKIVLCIGCVEHRLGRTLRAEDFLSCALNSVFDRTPKSKRLKERLGWYERGHRT